MKRQKKGLKVDYSCKTAKKNKNKRVEAAAAAQVMMKSRKH